MGIIETQRWMSPIGEMILGVYQGQLCLADWVDSPKRQIIDQRICRGLNAEFREEASDVANQAIAQLEEYFQRKRRTFDLPLRMVGTQFQLKVWNELLAIPYGTTISYGEEAQRIGHPKAVRAVAGANGNNPICIIVPCHRVIGADGKLTGYTGGLHIKEALLSIERN